MTTQPPDDILGALEQSITNARKHRVEKSAAMKEYLRYVDSVTGTTGWRWGYFDPDGLFVGVRIPDRDDFVDPDSLREPKVTDRPYVQDNLSTRAEVARRGLHDLSGWEDPEHGWIDPLDDDETRTEVRRTLTELGRAGHLESRTQVYPRTPTQ